MRAVEQRLFDSGLPVAALMEKVGLAMAARLQHQQPWLRDGVVVLVGPGHNGGDGLVVARELALAGVSVRIWCPFGVRRELPMQHLRHLHWLGIEPSLVAPDPSESSLWVDALFGLGQTRSLPEELASLFHRRQLECPDHLVSLDVPSGLCSDQGEPLGGQAACALLTLTVGLIKRGLCLDPARAWVGRLERIDIGLPSSLLLELAGTRPRRLPLTEISTVVCPRPPLAGMKYQRGRCLAVAGSERYPGAAHLALLGSLASGCGSVQAVLPDCVRRDLWQVLPEVVAFEEAVDKTSMEVERPCLQRLDALLFGPGLGTSTLTWNHWAERLRQFAGLLVLDADGLNALASSAEGWRWLLRREGPTFLTPHQAEFRRLFPEIEIVDSLQAALAAAACSECFVLLKGAHSAIAAPDGMALLLVGTSPEAARTGLGDVLAGFATGLSALFSAAAVPPTLETFASAALLHACSASQAPSSEASEIAECLKRLIRTHQKKSTKFAAD